MDTRFLCDEQQTHAPGGQRQLAAGYHGGWIFEVGQGPRAGLESGLEGLPDGIGDKEQSAPIFAPGRRVRMIGIGFRVNLLPSQIFPHPFQFAYQSRNMTQVSMLYG